MLGGVKHSQNSSILPALVGAGAAAAAAKFGATLPPRGHRSRLAAGVARDLEDGTSSTWAGVAVIPPVTRDRPEVGFQAPVCGREVLCWL